jgi:hypothetical protein
MSWFIDFNKKVASYIAAPAINAANDFSGAFSSSTRPSSPRPSVTALPVAKDNSKLYIIIGIIAFIFLLLFAFLIFRK